MKAFKKSITFHGMMIKIRSVLHDTNMLSGILVIAHYNISPGVDIQLHSDTLS
jgi:hypothetical protein